jgi:hypothetical protein
VRTIRDIAERDSRLKFPHGAERRENIAERYAKGAGRTQIHSEFTPGPGIDSDKDDGARGGTQNHREQNVCENSVKLLAFKLYETSRQPH